MVYFTIRSFLFNSEIYCPFSLQEFLRYNPFERTIVAGLLSRLCVSHKLLVIKGYGNDMTKHFTWYISITSLWKKLLLRTKSMSTKNVFPQLGGRGRPFP